MGIYKIAIYCILIFSQFAFAEEENVRVGEGKAVEEANEANGFKLSQKAKETIGIQLQKLSESPFKAPLRSLVNYGEKVGVYRYRDGWFKLVPVRIEKKSSGEVTFTSPELSSTDQIAISGAALLRVTDMDIFMGEG